MRARQGAAEVTRRRGSDRGRGTELRRCYVLYAVYDGKGKKA